MIKLLSYQNLFSIFCLKKLKKKTRRLPGSSFGNGGIVNHTFNVLLEFSMFQTLTSISICCLTISAYFFSERYLHNVYDIISDNFRLGKVQASGVRKVICCYFRLNPLCASFAYVFLNTNYSIDVNQASVKSRSVYFV